MEPPAPCPPSAKRTKHTHTHNVPARGDRLPHGGAAAGSNASAHKSAQERTRSSGTSRSQQTAGADQAAVGAGEDTTMFPASSGSGPPDGAYKPDGPASKLALYIDLGQLQINNAAAAATYGTQHSYVQCGNQQTRDHLACKP